MSARNKARLATLSARRGVAAHASVVVLRPGETPAEVVAALVASGAVAGNRTVLCVPAPLSVEQWQTQAQETQRRLAADAALHRAAKPNHKPERATEQALDAQPAAPTIPAWKQQEIADRKRQKFGTRDLYLH